MEVVQHKSDSEIWLSIHGYGDNGVEASRHIKCSRDAVTLFWKGTNPYQPAVELFLTLPNIYSNLFHGVNRSHFWLTTPGKNGFESKYFDASLALGNVNFTRIAEFGEQYYWVENKNRVNSAIRAFVKRNPVSIGGFFRFDMLNDMDWKENFQNKIRLYGGDVEKLFEEYKRKSFGQISRNTAFSVWGVAGSSMETFDDAILPTAGVFLPSSSLSYHLHSALVQFIGVSAISKMSPDTLYDILRVLTAHINPGAEVSDVLREAAG